MRKTLDQILKEHPLLQTYLALGGTYHFDSRDIVLNTPGHEEYTMPANMDQFGHIVKAHIEYMEEQMHRQHEYEDQCRRASEELEAEEYRKPERPWQFLLSDNADYS